VGNREKLLDGALACLYEKGYAHTTARDIVAAAGVSLAAIGYHFGTTEALLSAALVQAMQRWGEELERVLVDERDRELTPERRRVAIWRRIIASVRSNRPLWGVQFELVNEIQRRPDLAERFAGAQTAGREGLAELFEGIDPAADPERAHRVGAVYQALLTGVVAQHLVDPAHALRAEDLADAVPSTVDMPARKRPSRN
jgi:AcrR family transcriptional regulator